MGAGATGPDKRLLVVSAVLVGLVEKRERFLGAALRGPDLGEYGQRPAAEEVVVQFLELLEGLEFERTTLAWASVPE